MTCCPIVSEGRSVYSCITVFGIIYIKLLINTQYMRFVLFTEYLKLLFQQLLLLLRELLLITARLLFTCSFLPSSVNDSAAFSSLFIAKNPPFIYLFLLGLFRSLIHLSPSDKQPVKKPVAFLFIFVLRSSHEVAVHQRIPEGTATPSALPLLKLNTSNPQMAAFHLPPSLPSFHRGWHFSHFTHHYIQPRLYSCPSEEALLPSLTCFFCLSF